jgi:gluconolactonase
MAAIMVAFSLSVAAQDTRNFPTLGKVVRLDPRIDKLIPVDAKIEVLSSGFDWSEGPVWIKNGSFLLFSDIPRNSVMKWKEGEGISVWLKPSGYTGQEPYGREPGSNGLAVDAQGRLISCEHGDRRISRLEPSGGKRTLADNYMGKRLNSPNDLVVRSNGDIYFSDPPYGLPKGWDDPRRELDFCGVYLLSTDGKLTLLTNELVRPNGIALSPDEKTLYVAQSDGKRPIWMAFPVKPDGTVDAGRVFADASDMIGKLPGGPDGMKVDKAGNLWVTAPGGVHVYSPDGKRLGWIETNERTANCAWGDDGSTLYMTADMYLCRIRTTAKGIGW